MTDMLDELREMVLDYAADCPDGCNDEAIKDAFDDFRAKHPGLIDKTANCANCGLQLPNYYEDGSGGEINNPGWEYVWTFAGPKWLEPFEVDDEELHNIWLCCPACAKEAR